MPGERLTFGPFEVDPAAQVVLCNGEPLPIGTRGVQLLAALLRRPGAVVTKAELMDAAWPGTAVEESNLSVQMAALRRALAEGPEGCDWIATVPRVGYRLVGSAAQSPTGGSGVARPSIAVLPFVNLSNDAEQSFFADGLAEEIIVALGKISGILVIARNSSFAYRGAGIDVRQVARDLHVQYVLAGSVRRGGKRVRISVQLADGATAAQVWAETYDRDSTGIFEVQDEITRRVVAAVAPHISVKPHDMVPGTSSLEALELYMRGRALVSAALPTRAGIAAGIEALQAAARVDPTYVDPLVYLAVGYATAYSSQWADDPHAAITAARVSADRAVVLAPSSGETHAARALVAMLERDHRRMADESEAAVSLSPDSGIANILRGGYLVNDARPMLAVPFYEHAMRVDPGMTHLFIHHLGTAYLFAGHYETAAALFRSRIEMSPETDMSRAYLCVALGHLGEHLEARRVWDELMAIRPDYSLRERLSRWHYRNPADPERLLEGLRKAGLPVESSSRSN